MDNINGFRDALLAHMLSKHDGITDDEANEDMPLAELVALHDSLHYHEGGRVKNIADVGHAPASLEEAEPKGGYVFDLPVHIAAHSPKDAERRWVASGIGEGPAIIQQGSVKYDALYINGESVEDFSCHPYNLD